MKKIKYLTLILIIYSTGIFAQSFPDTCKYVIIDSVGKWHCIDTFPGEDSVFYIDIPDSLLMVGRPVISEIRFQSYDSSSNYISVSITNENKDTSVTIEGDTALAIISLFKEWSKQIDMYNDMEREKEFWKEMYYRKAERLNQTLDGIHETNRPKDKPKKSKA